MSDFKGFKLDYIEESDCDDANDFIDMHQNDNDNDVEGLNPELIKER